MGIVFRFLLAVVVALGAGVGSALWLIDGIAGASATPNGAWRVNTKIGSAAAGPYTRAMVALRGLLALDKSEAIYFFAGTDDAGDPLTGGCDYRVVGAAPPALWSSLTVYGGDDFLIPNPQERYSYPIAGIDGAGETFEVALSAREQDGDWLPVAADAPFSLALRLYLPAEGVVADPASFPAPRIVKEGCR